MNVLPAPLQKLVGEFFCFLGEGNFVGNLGGIFRDFFRPTKQRLKNFGEKFGAFFVAQTKNVSCKLRSADVPP